MLEAGALWRWNARSSGSPFPHPHQSKPADRGDGRHGDRRTSSERCLSGGRGARWRILQFPVLEPELPAQGDGRLCCAGLRGRRSGGAGRAVLACLPAGAGDRTRHYSRNASTDELWPAADGRQRRGTCRGTALLRHPPCGDAHRIGECRQSRLPAGCQRTGWTLNTQIASNVSPHSPTASPSGSTWVSSASRLRCSPTSSVRPHAALAARRRQPPHLHRVLQGDAIRRLLLANLDLSSARC